MKKTAFPSRFKQQWPALVATLMASLWLGFFPLWNTGTYAHITLDKYQAMQTLTATCGGLCFLSIIILLFQHRLKTIRLSWAHLLLVLYLGWMALACRYGAWHEQLNGSGKPAVLYGALRYEGLYTLLTYGAIFLCLSLFAPNMKALNWVAGITLALTAGLAGVQYFNTNPFGLFPRGHSILINYEFQSTLGNIDILSGYLCLVVPLMMGGWLLERHSGPWLAAGLIGVEWMLCIDVQSGLVVLLGIAGVLCLIALRYRVYRSKALAALAGICLMVSLRWMIRLPWLDGVKELSFIVSKRSLLPLFPAALLLAGSLVCHRHPGPDIPWKIVILLALAVVILALALFIRMDIPETAGGLWEIHEMLCGRPQDSFGSYRIAVWRHTLHMVKEHPVFGLGPDTFYYAMQDHLRVESVVLPETFDNPHNMYLSVMIGGGIPAFVFWLGLMLFLILRGLRRGGWCAVTALCCAAYLVQGIFVFSICLISPMFWATAGIACALASQKQKKEARPCP